MHLGARTPQPGLKKKPWSVLSYLCTITNILCGGSHSWMEFLRAFFFFFFLFQKASHHRSFCCLFSLSFIFLHTSGTRGVLVALHMAAGIYWGEGIKR